MAQDTREVELVQWLAKVLHGDNADHAHAISSPHAGWRVALIGRFGTPDGNKAWDVYTKLSERFGPFSRLDGQEPVKTDKESSRILAENEIERKAKEAHRTLHEEWQERISKRCQHIVNVFNGVFDLSIDADSVLVGEVSGAYAAINSRGPGLQLSQNVELSLETSNLVKAGTWLELEEGGEEAEWAKAYDAENFLVWHMLSHLADGPALRRMLRSVPEFRALSESDRSQACALALDAIALTFGEALYVHPDKRVHLATPVERQVTMLSALSVQTQRILKQSADAELDPGLKNLFLRFYVQISAHRNNVRRIVPTWSALHKRLGLKTGIKSEQQRAYEIVYEKARRLDIFKLKFHEQRQSLEEEEA